MEQKRWSIILVLLLGVVPSSEANDYTLETSGGCDDMSRVIKDRATCELAGAEQINDNTASTITSGSKPYGCYQYTTGKGSMLVWNSNVNGLGPSYSDKKRESLCYKLTSSPTRTPTPAPTNSPTHPTPAPTLAPTASPTPAPTACHYGNFLKEGICEACRAGYYQDAVDGTPCKKCGVGKYQNATGRTACRACKQIG